MIYLIDSRYFDAELVANYNFWKFNVLKNDVAGKKIEIHGNENSLIAISNKYSVNLHKLPLISSEVTKRRCI